MCFLCLCFTDCFCWENPSNILTCGENYKYEMCRYHSDIFIFSDLFSDKQMNSQLNILFSTIRLWSYAASKICIPTKIFFCIRLFTRGCHIFLGAMCVLVVCSQCASGIVIFFTDLLWNRMQLLLVEILVLLAKLAPSSALLPCDQVLGQPTDDCIIISNVSSIRASKIWTFVVCYQFFFH